MKTLWDADTRAGTLARIDRIDADTRPVWGTMTAERMLAHLAESLKMALGITRCESKMLPIRFFPLKQLILYVFPFPKGAPTAPELLAGEALPVDDRKREIHDLVGTFAAREGRSDWPVHPAFGGLSAKAWGALTAKHFDHHLRQFGV